MEIIKNLDGSKLNVVIKGRLDTTTAPELEAEIKDSIEGITDLVFDFSDLEYVSSAGLRIILSTQKTMNKQGEMTLTNVNSDIMEVFEITGFVDILNIQ